MLNNIRASWALFLGIGFMMLGNGLQGTLLGLRATMEGFPIFTTGVMMSGYFIGIFIGSMLAPKLVKRVGHIRVFAALASLASIAILLHGLYINPLTWMLMRLVTGISYAGIYVVSESWINDRSTNETRGKMLSIYMVIITLGLAGGQFLLNIADPMKIDLFILVSVVVSFGLIPMLLTARPAPGFETSSKMSLMQLFRASPLAVFSNMMTGAAYGTIFGLGAVYARQQGFSVESISWFMASFMVGSLFTQWPIGYLSDRIDRRIVMAIISVVAISACITALLMSHETIYFYGVIVILGGAAIPMYSLCIAYANDRLEPEQIVAASASLVMVAGIGSTTGPILVSFLMSEFGIEFYFIGIGGTFLLIFLFTIHRMVVRGAIGVRDQIRRRVMPGQIGTPVAAFVGADAKDYIENVVCKEQE